MQFSTQGLMHFLSWCLAQVKNLVMQSENMSRKYTQGQENKQRSAIEGVDSVYGKNIAHYGAECVVHFSSRSRSLALKLSTCS